MMNKFLDRCNEQEKIILQSVSQVAIEEGIDCYAVGGFVRDKILDRQTKDIDIVCTSQQEKIAHKIIKLLNPSLEVTTFKNFGVSHFSYKGLDIEIVTARKESYQQHSRKPAVEVGTLEDDFKRRDFTINALAIGLNKENFGILLDHFDGLESLAQKKIETPTDPDATFSDDPLRILRAIRFACQLDFTIDKNTWSSMLRQRERITILSKERITAELNKILSSPKPSIGLKLLDEAHLWQYIVPEVTKLKGVDYVEGKGHKDNFYHTLQVVDNVATRSEDLWLRWAALLHDIAKPRTKRFEPGRGWTFHGHDFIGSKMVKPIFKSLKLPLNEKMAFVIKMVLLHLRPISLTKEEVTDSAMRRLLFDAGEHIEDLMMLCESDITSKSERKVQQYLSNFQYVRKRLTEVQEKDKMRNFQLALDGISIMKMFDLTPSKEVGIIKQKVLDAVLDGVIENTETSTKAFAKQIYQEVAANSTKKIED